MSNVFNVKSAPYNAAGDGVHDDTAAINAALADAALDTVAPSWVWMED